MAEIIKYKSTEILFHIRHNIREIPTGKQHGNTAIDPSKTHLNYSLIKRGKTADEINKYRKQIEDEIFQYNRANLVHAIEVVFQCPSDCPDNQKELFFRECYKYIVSLLPMGERCIFLAEVHRDERHSPQGQNISKDHLHICFIPAVVDTKHDGYKYKLRAHDFTDRKALKNFHPKLQQHLKKAGVNATVYSDKKDGKSIGLSVAQLKEITQKTGIVLKKSLTIDELCNILREHQNIRLQNKTLQNKIASYESQIENLKNQLIEIQNQRELETSQSQEWGHSTTWDDKTWGNNSFSREEDKLW